MNTYMAEEILRLLHGKGIKAHLSGKQVAVNRTSMCNSPLAGSGMPEETTYPAVLSFLQDATAGSLYHLYWAGKTDDDLFLDSMV